MDDFQLTTSNIFYPELNKRAFEAQTQGFKFVQYTSASSALSMLHNKELWLRNSICMNDYSEIQHGLNCLIEAFNNSKAGDQLKATMESLFPGVLNEFIGIFDSWIPVFKNDTYIACFSEHPKQEEKYGRLSMWRAYGGDNPIALVFNPQIFHIQSDAFNAYSYPVIYTDIDDFNNLFSSLSTRIKQNEDFLKIHGKSNLINQLFTTFKGYVTCVKHPGFSEEREWRVVYNPKHASSKNMRQSLETINGVPQIVHKIPIKDIPEEGFVGASIPELINRIIIGPTDNQSVLAQAFEELLRNEGCSDAGQRIFTSGIPLR